MLKLLLGDDASGADINSVKLIVAALIIHTIGPQTVLVLPGFVQGLVEYVGFTDQQAGFIASTELMGMTAGTIAMMALVGRANWRVVFLVSLALIAAGNFASIVLTDFYALCAARFVIGVGGGFIVSLSYTVFGLTAKADRNFALGIFFVLLYAAVVYPFLPVIFSGAGLAGLLIFMGAFAIVGLPFVRYMPRSGEEHRELDDQAIALDWPRKVLALAAMLVFFSANFAVWTYLFRVGVLAGVAEQDVANGLSFSQFLGMAGAFTCALVGAAFGRGIMLAIAILGCALPLAFLFGPIGALGYAAVVGAYQYGWNMAHPYLLAAMASFDPSGKMVVYATAMQFIGISLGPAIAAAVVSGVGFSGVLLGAVVALIVSLALILPPVLAQSAASRAGPAA
ncbi:MAG: MFS transporter [Caulobacterales bacterium]|nr:MFS transporter [Caulobacterales bacterium]